MPRDAIELNVLHDDPAHQPIAESDAEIIDAIDGHANPSPASRWGLPPWTPSWG
jgi:hypothetical protein